MDVKEVEKLFAAKEDEITQLVEDIISISDGLPSGSVIVALMTTSMMLFEQMGISKKDAVRFFKDACDENMVE